MQIGGFEQKYCDRSDATRYNNRRQNIPLEIWNGAKREIYFQREGVENNITGPRRANEQFEEYFDDNENVYGLQEVKWQKCRISYVKRHVL